MLRTVLGKILLLLVSLGLVLVCGEVLVRTARPQQLSVWGMTSDGFVTLRPDASTWLARFDRTVRSNAIGMRDVDHDLEKVDGRFRILVLGDSFVEALQVPLAASLHRRLEAELGQGVDVMSASVSGWGTDDQAAWLSRHGLAFEPDLVLVAITLYNDLSDNLAQDFHVLDDGDLRARPVVRTPPWRYGLQQAKALLVGRSHLYRLFSLTLRSREYRDSADQLNEHVSGLIRRERPAAIDRGWDITFRLLDRIGELAESTGAATAYVAIPMQMQVSSTRRAEFLRDNELDPAEIDLEAPQRTLDAWARESETELIQLLGGFAVAAARSPNEPLYLESDGHWTESGHALAARIVARELRERGIVP